MNRSALLVFLLCAASLAGTAHAAKSKKLSEQRIEPQQFSEYRELVENELRDGDSLAQMSSEHRAEVRAILERMDAQLSGVASVQELPDDDRRDVFNNQERLRVLLGQAEEDSRLICKRETVVGSRLAKNVCISVAERRRQQEDSQQMMRRGQAGRATGPSN